MAEKSIIKKYRKGDFAIVWEPKKCIHAAICVKELPQVYNPQAKPWIQQDNASIEALKKQIDMCPSGALSYEEKDNFKTENHMKTEVELMKNGPLLVKGDVAIKDANGVVVIKEKMTAFCRCGASANKPYCDGKHKVAGFEG